MYNRKCEEGLLLIMSVMNTDWADETSRVIKSVLIFFKIYLRTSQMTVICLEYNIYQTVHRRYPIKNLIKMSYRSPKRNFLVA